MFNQFGDLERSALRPGNVHSADGWKNVLEPVVARYRERDLRRYFRADAAFWKTFSKCERLRISALLKKRIEPGTAKKLSRGFYTAV